MNKTFWLIELPGGIKPIYLAHFIDGVAFTLNPHQACKFALEKYARLHLINAKAMNPSLADVLVSARVVVHDFDWSKEAQVRLP